MKNYLINATLGIFLGFLSGKFYLLFLDKVFFNNYISNMNDFDQSFHGALLPIFVSLVFLFIKEVKEGNFGQDKNIQTIIFLIGGVIAASFLSWIINIVFNLLFATLFGEKLSEDIGGFTLGSVAGFLMISYFFTKMQLSKRF